MPGEFDSNQIKSWTWEDELSTYNKDMKEKGAVAASVSSFQSQKVPFSQSWDKIIHMGNVCELELSADLIDTDFGEKLKKSNHEDGISKEKLFYWFVELISVEGYFLNVQFLGFPANLSEEVKRKGMWVHCSQLKDLGHYKDIGTAVVPNILKDVVLNRDVIWKRLYDQVVRKQTVHPLFFYLKKQAAECKWRTNMAVEVHDKDCYNHNMRSGFVLQTVGRRVEVLYAGVSARQNKGFWAHEDSNLIQPQGWAKTTGAKINSFKNSYDPAPLEPTELGVDTKLTSEVKLGMLFEFINPIRLNEIAVGKVTRVLSHGYFNCQIESYISQEDLDEHTNGVNEFHYHVTSDEIFPLGTFAAENPSPKPLNAKGKGFTWAYYLKREKLEELHVPSKTMENSIDHFKEGMLIEAVDAPRPDLVCPAKIMKIVSPYAMKVRFLGWTKDFDQWKPIKSFELFPIGWCQLTNFPLEPPNPVEEPAP